jgi:uncharacterized protein (DUF1015 family)
MRLRPFRAWRPVPTLAASVASPPYDVVSRAEARALAGDNALTFLRVVRSEIDLPEDVEPYDVRVYARARENLDRLIREGTFLREPEPALYLYRLAMEGRAQVGVVGCVHVDDYERGVIKKHETTRPDKEDDRTRHMLALEAHAEAVLLAYRGGGEIDRLAGEAMERQPIYDFVAADGVHHTLWTLPDPDRCVEAFHEVPGAYVADGHHRTASAWRAARRRRRGMPNDEREWFPAALFPAEQLRILPYNRVVADLGGQTPDEVLSELAKVGRLGPTTDPTPPRPGSFCIYLDGRWRLLELPESSIQREDVLASLDVALLQERVLTPVLGVGDPRTDKRIDFVGGLQGPPALEARVDSGQAALAVSLQPTTVEQLMAVADRGEVMPPKSTWFEPKLASGLFVHGFR